jgi:hypothetical protein
MGSRIDDYCGIKIDGETFNRISEKKIALKSFVVIIYRDQTCVSNAGHKTCIKKKTIKDQFYIGRISKIVAPISRVNNWENILIEIVRK